MKATLKIELRWLPSLSSSTMLLILVFSCLIHSAKAVWCPKIRSSSRRYWYNNNVAASTAFVVLPIHKNNHILLVTRKSSSSQLQLSSSTSSMSRTVKNEFISTAMQLKEENGIFLIEKSAKDRLKIALESFERSCTGPEPSFSSNPSLLLGDWELICTTASDVQGFDLPSFLNQGPLKDIRDAVRKTTNKYLNVQQRILATNTGKVDRIDHVLEYNPPSELRDVLDSLPEQINNLNINPLQVQKSKVVLLHKASVESDTKPLSIKLSLSQIIWNVAGTSTILDPSGRDLANINIPFGDFLNAGEFETTYLDETLRISRGKQGFVNDQIRIFMRKSVSDVGETVDAELDDNDDEGEIETPSDVEVL